MQVCSSLTGELLLEVLVKHIVPGIICIFFLFVSSVQTEKSRRMSWGLLGQCFYLQAAVSGPLRKKSDRMPRRTLSVPPSITSPSSMESRGCSVCSPPLPLLESRTPFNCIAKLSAGFLLFLRQPGKHRFKLSHAPAETLLHGHLSIQPHA